MTLRTRNTILLLGALHALIVVAAFIASAAYVFGSDPVDAQGVPGLAFFESLAREWSDLPASDLAFNYFIAGLVSFFSLIAGIWLRTLFLRTSSAEIFFFVVFILSLALEGLRPLIAVGLAHGASLGLSVFMTRAVYFGYFLGVFSLFAASLFALEIQFQKIGTVLWMVFFLSFLLAFTIGIDISEIHPTLVLRLGRKEFLRIILLGFGLLTWFNFTRAAVLAGSQDQLFITFSIGLIIGGREALFASSPLFTVIGLCVLILGSIVFVRKSYSRNLFL